MFDFRKKEKVIFPISKTVSWLSWAIFFSAALLMGLFVLWAFLGTVVITVSGRGVVVSQMGFTNIEAPHAGTISRLHVRVGDRVQKGKLLIETTKPDDKIESNLSGQVLEVMAKPGDFVKEGASLIWMEVNTPEKKDSVYIYGYFPLHSSKRLKVETPIVMRIPSITYNKYGAIKGKIKNISLYAESKESLHSEFQNKALVDYLFADSPAVVKVLIEPVYQDGHLVWTSGLHPPNPISTGTVGIIEAIVEKVTPLYYLIPLSHLKTSAFDNEP